MLGAIIGDIVGSRFEWYNIKTKKFELFDPMFCKPTDDSIMTLAIARAVMEYKGDLGELSELAVSRMRALGNHYPHAGYGGHFRKWLTDYVPKPYNSWGNGAAMRVSACAYGADSLEEAIAMSRAVTEVSHNHPEGIKGAEAVTVAIYMALHGSSLDEIRQHILDNYYKIDFTLDDIRPSYDFDVSCHGSVPQALEAFFESVDFEDAIRNAVSIGGDSDTIAAITGGIAQAYYGIPDDIRIKAMGFLDDLQKSIVEKFEEKFSVK